MDQPKPVEIPHKPAKPVPMYPAMAEACKPRGPGQ